MPGPLDDNDYAETQALLRGGRGGRGPTGGPGGTGPAGLASSLGYGGGGLGQGGAYSAAGGFARRRRRPVGGYAGQPAAPQTAEQAIAAIRGGGAGPVRTAMPLSSRSSQPVAEGGAPVVAAPAPATGSGRRYSGIGGRIQDMIDRGVRDGRLPGPTGTPAAAPGVDASDEFNRWLRGWIEGGGLSPEGNAAEWDAIRGEVSRASDAGTQRALTSAKLHAGGDPQALAFAKIMAEVQGGRGRTEAMGAARAGMAGRQGDFLRSLYRRGLDQDWGFDDRQQGYDLERARQQGEQGNWWDDIVDMGGGAIGSFLGGWGSERGRRAAGGK